MPHASFHGLVACFHAFLIKKNVKHAQKGVYSSTRPWGGRVEASRPCGVNLTRGGREFNAPLCTSPCMHALMLKDDGGYHHAEFLITNLYCLWLH